MNKQTTIEPAMNVHRKLSTARQRFHSLKLEKTGENKFAGYKYFELGDFLIPALKVFDEVGLSAVVTFKSDIAAMQITDMDNTSDTIVITSPMGSAALKGCHEVQNIGAVETYQRRYLWVAALEIVEHDALDATNGKVAPEKTAKPSPKAEQGEPYLATDAQRDMIQQIAAAVQKPLEDICKAYSVPSLKFLTAKQADATIKRLQEMAPKKETVDA